MTSAPRGYLPLPATLLRALPPNAPVPSRLGVALRTIVAVIEAPPTDACVEWPHARSTDGYGYVKLGHVHGHQVSALILRGVGRPWHPPLGHFALHACDNPPCVNPRHLSWGTHARNQREKMDRGRHSVPFGEAHKNARLTNDLVRAIRKRHASGEYAKAIASDLGVGETTVGRVLRGETWAHVSDVAS